jgi:hypothetical protein
MVGSNIQRAGCSVDGYCTKRTACGLVVSGLEETGTGAGGPKSAWAPVLYLSMSEHCTVSACCAVASRRIPQRRVCTSRCNLVSGRPDSSPRWA